MKELVAWNRERGYPYRFMAEASLNLANDESLLESMYLANFVSIFIGIETPDPKLLRGTMKMQNIPGDPLAKLRRIRDHGIHVCAGFIVGFDDEERGVFDVQRRFIEDSGIGMAMIGLLQAGPHTELWRRLKRENRLLEDIRITGVSTSEGINFVPRGELTKREYLERYSELAKELYQPEAFFRRIVPALLELRYPTWHRGLFGVWFVHYAVMARQLFWLGIWSRATRRHYWRALLTISWKNPFALEAFGYECFHFWYLHQHVDWVRRHLLSYVEAPAPTDVLDEIVPSDSTKTGREMQREHERVS